MLMDICIASIDMRGIDLRITHIICISQIYFEIRSIDPPSIDIMGIRIICMCIHGIYLNGSCINCV